MNEMFDLQGKVALVTGGSRGLGLAMARALGRRGARIVITARKVVELEWAVDDLNREGLQATAIPSDVADRESTRDLVSKVLMDFGSIEILVNNAGVTWAASAEELTPQAWQRVVDVNLTGAWALTQDVATRSMIPRGNGSIVFIASTAGLFGNRPGGVPMMVYNTTKAGQINMVRSLAGEWGRYGIRVNALLPGWFPTRLTKGALADDARNFVHGIPLQRLGEIEDVAGPIVFLSSDASRYVTGQALAVDGGMSCVL